MRLEEKLNRTTELMELWGESERLCTAICQRLDWATDGDEVRRLQAALRRARARALRRLTRYGQWYRSEL